jgi:hypothetical protein
MLTTNAITFRKGINETNTPAQNDILFAESSFQTVLLLYRLVKNVVIATTKYMKRIVNIDTTSSNIA